MRKKQQISKQTKKEKKDSSLVADGNHNCFLMNELKQKSSI